MKELFEKQDKEFEERLDQEAIDFIILANTQIITRDGGDSYTPTFEILKEKYIVQAKSHISKIRQETRDAAYTKGFDDAMLTVERRVENALKDVLKSLDI